jgi:hypothetical protein
MAPSFIFWKKRVGIGFGDQANGNSVIIHSERYRAEQYRHQ